MQCKASCGRSVLDGVTFCVDCLEAWAVSPEERRASLAITPAARSVALTDFCNRVRAERRPEVQR